MNGSICVECHVATTYFCETCQVWLCYQHKLGHGDIRICVDCKRPTCREQMQTEELCFSCWAQSELKRVETKYLENIVNLQAFTGALRDIRQQLKANTK